MLDKPYQDGLPSLAAYPVASNLLGHGIASEAMFEDYLQLTKQFQQMLSQYGFEFDRSENFEDGSVFWALAEAREGSIILEFVLVVWITGKVINGVMDFLQKYKGSAEGLERLTSDVTTRFIAKADNSAKQASVIITEDIEEELRKLRNKKH